MRRSVTICCCSALPRRATPARQTPRRAAQARVPAPPAAQPAAAARARVRSRRASRRRRCCHVTSYPETPLRRRGLAPARPARAWRRSTRRAASRRRRRRLRCQRRASPARLRPRLTNGFSCRAASRRLRGGFAARHHLEQRVAAARQPPAPLSRSGAALGDDARRSRPR